MASANKPRRGSEAGDAVQGPDGLSSAVRRRHLAAAAALGASWALGTLPGEARAQSSFPSKPVRLVVGFPAGGAADLGARQIAQRLSDAMGKPVVVDNKAGGDGTIAGLEVMRSAPDGHTLFLATATALSYAPNARKTPPYDPIADFTPVTYLCTFTFYLVVHQSLPVKTMEEFVAHVRANPGKLSYGTGNSTGIVSTAQFLAANKLEMVHVPYKGEAQAALDLIPGRVHAMFVTPAVMPTLMKDKSVRPLATLLPTRTALAPEVPTMAEAGQPLVDIAPWGGIVGPPQMPRELVDRWNREFQQVMTRADLKEQMDQLGLPMRASTPEEFAAFLRRQQETWSKVMREAKISSE